MPNKKNPISEESKEEIKGFVQGAYDNVELIPQESKKEKSYNEIVEALKADKFYVMREKFTRNSVYVLLKKLKETSQLEASFGVTVKDGIKQFVLFPKKEELKE